MHGLRWPLRSLWISWEAYLAFTSQKRALQTSVASVVRRLPCGWRVQPSEVDFSGSWLWCWLTQPCRGPVGLKDGPAIWCSGWSAGYAYGSAPAASGVPCTGSMSQNPRWGWWERPPCTPWASWTALCCAGSGRESSCGQELGWPCRSGRWSPCRDSHDCWYCCRGIWSRRPSSAVCHQLKWWVGGQLKQVLAETGSLSCPAEADGKTEEAGGFCKLVDDSLEVKLPMHHEDTVVSKQCFQDSLFHNFCLGCQPAKVQQGAVEKVS